MIMWLVVPCLAIAVLYFWLIGHWFGRILAFPALVALFELIVFATLSSIRGDQSPRDLAVRWALMIGCLPAGWVASGIPMWHWQAKARMLARGQQLRA